MLHEPKKKRLDSQTKAARMGKAFEMRHIWWCYLGSPIFREVPVCVTCGMCRRADGKNENTCKGPVRIVLRKQGMIRRANAPGQLY